MLMRALEAVDLGFPVFPIHGVFQDPCGVIRCTCGNPDCNARNRGKHPATRNGLLDATRDPSLVRSWYDARPQNNWAGRTGDLVVLDIDLDKAGDRSLNDLEAKHGRLPRTWISRTGNGFHAVFAPPAGSPIACSTGKIGSGLDVKSQNGYIVLPGSRHYSGRTYEWHAEYHPDNTPLAILPDWLASLCREARPTALRAHSNEELARLVNGDAGDGTRNDTLTRLVGHVIWTGKVSPHIVLEFARLWNARHCKPPLDDNEVFRVVNSICGRELLKRGPR